MTDHEAKIAAALAKFEKERGIAPGNWQLVDQHKIPPFSTQSTDHSPLTDKLRQVVSSGGSNVDWCAAALAWLWARWAADYRSAYPGSDLVKVSDSGFTYWFDEAGGRQLGASKILAGSDKSFERDSSRMKGFPAHADKAYQKGHMMAHQLGGGTDINLFHQLGIFNNGPFRELENLALKTGKGIYFVHLGYANAAWEEAVLRIRRILDGSEDGGLKRTYEHPSNFFGAVARDFHPQAPMIVEQGFIPYTREGEVLVRRFANNAHFRALMDLAKQRLPGS